MDEEDQEFQEEFLGDKDPSILHFLLASGEEVETDPPTHLSPWSGVDCSILVSHKHHIAASRAH